MKDWAAMTTALPTEIPSHTNQSPQTNALCMNTGVKWLAAPPYRLVVECKWPPRIRLLNFITNKCRAFKLIELRQYKSNQEDNTPIVASNTAHLVVPRDKVKCPRNTVLMKDSTNNQTAATQKSKLQHDEVRQIFRDTRAPIMP